MCSVTIIPEELCGLNFIMTPTTEDVIRGRDLQEGMVVLIEPSVLRESLPDGKHEYPASRMARILETNRWCLVTELEFHHDIVSFIGVYADGRKASRDYNTQYTWYVKRMTQPEVVNVEYLCDQAFKIMQTLNGQGSN